MTNAKVKFIIDGVERSLYFGMVATQIFAEKGAKLAENNTNANNVKSFAYLVYAGLCNQADLLDNAYPTFEEAYELTEKIIEQGEELQNQIFTTWQNSKPAKNMLEMLPKSEEVAEEGKKKEPSQSRKTGTKSKPSPSVS